MVDLRCEREGAGDVECKDKNGQGSKLSTRRGIYVGDYEALPSSWSCQVLIASARPMVARETSRCAE